MEPRDVEQELADILQTEIWKEITATTGETRDDYDKKIIEILLQLKNTQE